MKAWICRRWTQVQEDEVTTWTQGDYAREHMVKALRKLEKVSRDRSGKVYFQEPGEAMEGGDEVFATMPETDREIENYIYLEEGDLNQIFDESEVMEALATYQQVRKALRDQRNARGWSKGSGKSGKSGGGSSGGLQLGRGSRVHVEALKLRTRCARCGVVGHWAKECTNPPDDYAKQRQTGSSTGSSPTGKSPSSNMAGKSGFVHVGSSTGGSVLMAMEQNTADTSSFVGVTTSGEFGLVDTAAQAGLIGKAALQRSSSALQSHGLKVRWTDRKGQARGVGGDAKVVGVCEVPLGLAGSFASSRPFAS